ncbi:transposase, partial [Streptomyces sp. NPDC004296]
RAADLRKYAEGHDWLTIVQLPSFAPDLNPVEGIWSLLRRRYMANVAFENPDHLTQTLRHGLACIQRRPHLLDGCLAETGLTITTPSPTPPRKSQ